MVFLKNKKKQKKKQMYMCVYIYTYILALKPQLWPSRLSRASEIGFSLPIQVTVFICLFIHFLLATVVYGFCGGWESLLPLTTLTF